MRNEIGVMASLQESGPSLKYVADFGLKVCQLCCWKQERFTDERADAIRAESRERGVRITSLWAGWPGPTVWDQPAPVLLMVPAPVRTVLIGQLSTVVLVLVTSNV